MIDTQKSPMVTEELSNSEKVKPQNNIGETTIKILNPGGLKGVSTFDYVELRNYIYGVNGRY
jgi:hypothetical protein